MRTGHLVVVGDFLTRAIRSSRLLCFALFLSLASVAVSALPAPSSIVIDRALSLASDASRFPIDGVPAPVTLPDTWETTHPGYEGVVWYRTVFRLDTAEVPDEPLAVYLDRVCSNLQIYLNGSLMFSSGNMREPVTRNCLHPLFATLPVALLRTQSNVLDFRVVGHPLERVASRQSAAGFSPVEIGLQSVLVASHSAHLFWGVTWVEASSLVLLGLGCVLVAVGWLNSREVYFSYLGWLCLAWAAMSLASWASDLPWGNGVTEFLLCSWWAVMLALAVQFLLSFAGLRSRTIEWLVALQWVLLPLSLVLAGPDRLFAVARVWYVMLALELAGAMAIYLVTTWRRRPYDFGPMALLGIGGGAALALEIAVQSNVLAAPAVSVAHFTVPLLLGALGTRLFLMFARALRATEEDRNRIAAELKTLHAEMVEKIEQVSAQRIEQFTEQERKRIASDLHDDLGAKLLTIVHTRDAASIPDLARDALEEMRLAVRGLTGKPVPIDDALADWRAEVVERLGQAGIEAAWTLPADMLVLMLPARIFMQVTRILREAVSNVIKHSGARRCVVSCERSETELRLRVSDDGHGIAADLNRGQGMTSMKRRAKRIGGQCLVETRPDRGVVISLTVPL